ncbi:MAG TPA: DinB family protein [Acidimicrobiia bacterium]|nr:DinB family protein [Acidimicrobiia bacterium]
MAIERCPECGFDGATWTDLGAVAAIGELPSRFAAAVDGLADADAQRRAIPHQWSIAEYVDHVRETLFGMRFVLSIAVDAPGTDLGDPPAAPFEPEPRVVDVPAALDGLRAQAEQLHDQLADLATSAWDTTVVIGRDPVDVHWIARHAIHDATHHLGDIERLREAR